MEPDKRLRQQLAKFLDWHEAHADLSTAVNDFPTESRGKVPTGMEHSPWQLLEHIRIAMWDIVEFCRDTRHKSPAWPDSYWPKAPAPPNHEAWDESVKAIHASLDAMRKLVQDPELDLFAPLAGGSGQTLLREVLLAADHNAYHLGQLVLTRKALGAWKG
jgi:DinB superfamily